jgi:hypothetical protein
MAEKIVDCEIVLFMQEILLSRKCFMGAMYVNNWGKFWYEIILTSEADESS